jgi:hypothetical protein
MDQTPRVALFLWEKTLTISTWGLITLSRKPGSDFPQPVAIKEQIGALNAPFGPERGEGVVQLVT